VGVEGWGMRVLATNLAVEHNHTYSKINWTNQGTMRSLEEEALLWLDKNCFLDDEEFICLKEELGIYCRTITVFRAILNREYEMTSGHQNELDHKIYVRIDEIMRQWGRQVIGLE